MVEKKIMFFNKSMIRNFHAGFFVFWFFFFTFALLFPKVGQGSQPSSTIDAKYPGLVSGILGAAELERMNEEILLSTDDVRIKKAELLEIVRKQEPKLRRQLEKNLLFILEQEATRRILLIEAKKMGISTSGLNEDQAIQELFERKSFEAVVSEEEAAIFYKKNKETMGGASFDQVKEGLHQYLLQEKKQRSIASYIASLSDSIHIRINNEWVKTQSQIAMDNSVDKARHSGRPTMVEFGATGCVPCDMMQPILEKLRKTYTGKLNVIFVHVGEDQILAARYGIRSIPVQVFFDDRGKEVFRHVGFFPQTEVTKQLVQMGVKK